MTTRHPKDLQDAFTPTQAEALAKALNAHVSSDLATKAEIEAIETRLGNEIKNLEAILRGEIKNLEATLRGEIKELKVDIVRLIMGVLFVNIFGIAGFVITLIKVMH